MDFDYQKIKGQLVSYFSPVFELTYLFFQVEIDRFSIEITKHNPSFEMLCFRVYWRY